MSTESTVYIVQEPTKWNSAKQRREVVFDVTPARVYGRLEVLIEDRYNGIITVPMVRDLRHKLRNFTDFDYLLALGNPSAIGAACAVAANQNNGRFKLLQWDRATAQYIEFAIDVRK